METFLSSISNKFKDFDSIQAIVNKIRYAQSKNEEVKIVKTYLSKARSLLREENIKLTARIMQKVIYIQTVGYSCKFATVHCLKLIDSRDIYSKHIGYITVTVIIDTCSDMPLLLCNSMRKDLENSNQYVIGLALNCFANICSPIFVEQFHQNILNLFNHKRSYVRKKSILCAARLINCSPSHAAAFIKPTLPLIYLTTKRMVMPTLILAIEICKSDPQHLVHEFEGWIKRLCHILKNLITRSSTTYQISGSNHPYMQIRIIRLLALIGTHNPLEPANLKLIEQTFRKVLNVTKQVFLGGQAVIYELVLSCFKIQGISQRLKDDCVDTLSSFLQSSDFNLQYVSLNMLNQIIRLNSESIIVLKKNQPSLYSCLLSESPAVKLRAIKLIKYVCFDSDDFTQLATLLISALQSALDSKIIFDEADVLISQLAQRFYLKDQKFVMSILSLLIQNELIQYFPETISFTKQFILSSLFNDHCLLVSKLIPIFLHFLRNASEKTENIFNQPYQNMPSYIKQDLFHCLNVSTFVCWVFGEFNEIFLERDINFITKKILMATKMCYLSFYVWKELSISTMQIITNALLKIMSQRNVDIDENFLIATLRNNSTSDFHINSQISIFETLSESERKFVFSRSPLIELDPTILNINSDFEAHLFKFNNAHNLHEMNEPSTVVDEEELILFDDDAPKSNNETFDSIKQPIEAKSDEKIEKVFHSPHIELKISSVQSKKQIRFEVRRNRNFNEVLDKCSIDILPNENYSIQPWFQSMSKLTNAVDVLYKDFFIQLSPDILSNKSNSLSFIFNFSYFIKDDSFVFNDHAELNI